MNSFWRIVSLLRIDCLKANKMSGLTCGMGWRSIAWSLYCSWISKVVVTMDVLYETAEQMLESFDEQRMAEQLRKQCSHDFARVYSVAFSPSGNLLACAGSAGIVNVFDLRTAEAPKESDAGADSSQAVHGRQGMEMQIATPLEWTSERKRLACFCIAWLSEKVLLVADGERLVALNVDNCSAGALKGTVVYSLTDSQTTLTSMKVMLDQHIIICGTSGGDVEILRISHGKAADATVKVQRYFGPNWKVHVSQLSRFAGSTTAFSVHAVDGVIVREPDSATGSVAESLYLALATEAGTGTVLSRRLDDRSALPMKVVQTWRTEKGEPAMDIKFDRSGIWVAIGSAAGVRIRMLHTPEVQVQIPVPYPVTKFTWTNNDLVCVGQSRKLTWWSVDGRMMATMPLAKCKAHYALDAGKFDGMQLIAIGGTDGHVRIVRDGFNMMVATMSVK